MTIYCVIAIEPLSIGGELVSILSEKHWSSCNLVPSAIEKSYWCEPGQHRLPQNTCSTHKGGKNGETATLRQYLRLGSTLWYHWPHCDKEDSCQWLEKMYDSYKVRQKYKAFAKSGEPKFDVSKANEHFDRMMGITRSGTPTRCVFCHEELGPGLNVQCSKCGSTLHISCSKELTDICPCYREKK